MTDTAQQPLPPPVEVRGVTLAYGDRTILQDLNFTIERGQIVTILGGSGCGKSTLLKHIIGLYTPKAGDILIFGRSIVHANDEERRSIMTGFGVAYQGGALFRSMTVAENIALPMEESKRYTQKEINERVREKLAMVHLDGYEKFMPSDLSGGMIKRAAFARALALDPELLFFDEPSAGLDPLTSDMLDEVILEIREQTKATIIMVTHELPSIFKISDRIVMLSKEEKKIIDDGSPAWLRDHSQHEFVRNFLSRNGKQQRTE